MFQGKFKKSQTNVWVSGLIAGIGEYFGWGKGAIKAMRIIFLILVIGSYGGLMFAYIIASLLIPSKK